MLCVVEVVDEKKGSKSNRNHPIAKSHARQDGCKWTLDLTLPMVLLPLMMLTMMLMMMMMVQ